MNNSFSSQQRSKTGNLESSFILCQYQPKLKAEFLQTKVKNPNLRQSEIADHLRYSSSRLQRYRSDINMLLPDIIQPNNTNERAKKVSETNLDNNSHREHDFKRPQLTSIDLKTISKRTS